MHRIHDQRLAASGLPGYKDHHRLLLWHSPVQHDGQDLLGEDARALARFELLP
ncbi:hypothetical protein ABZW30_43875 [Kitasatospora sp. NPDC004669]|uniref:hypothetical protein n=1 Tax=Kitasatospora sp. NPDC004669 TaxID=3154555 RepID=UPI00339E1B68